MRLHFSIESVFLVLIAFMFVPTVAAQRVTRLIKTNGWHIPQIENLEIATEDEIDIGAETVTRVNFKLVDPKPFIKLKTEKCEFAWLSAYKIEGKTFAIGGDCVKFGNDQRYGKFYYGGIGNITFYDNDGDRKFETRYSSGFFKIFIPDRLRKHPPPFPQKSK